MQNASRSNDALRVLQQRPLQRKVLGDRLDHDLGIRRIAEVVRQRKTLHRIVDIFQQQPLLAHFKQQFPNTLRHRRAAR